MAPVYRAYGQIRRGSGPWRRPFLIPTAPLLGHEGYISIDNGGPQADLRVQLRVLNFTSLDDFRVGFLVSKLRPVSDITLRLALLKSAKAFFVDTGPLEKNASFAVLQHRTLPGRQFPGDLKINVDVGRPLIDPAIDDPAVPVTASTGMRATAIKISVESGLKDDLEMAGGLVDGDMIAILGVETTGGTLAGGYSEHDNQLRGIDLAWLDAAGPLPPSATWVDITATNHTTDPAKLDVTLNMPETGEPPTAAPAVTAVAGGAMRPGVYRYRLVYVTQNGNETSAGPRSKPVTATPALGSVRVDGFPPLPPEAEPTGPKKLVKLRVYRTDPDVPDPALPPDPQAGDSGDDVRVADLPLTATSFTDTGTDPLASGTPDVIKPDLILLDYASPHAPPLDLAGGIRLIGTDTTGAAPVTTDARYTGSVTAAPAHLRVAYQPGTAPRLRWSGSAAVPALKVGLAPLETPLGTGVDVTVTGVPTRLGIDWTSLGSEYFQLALLAATSLDPAKLGTAGIGRAGARLGTAAPPASWPAGEAAVAVEMTTKDAAPPTAPGGLAALTGLRRATITSGARAWSQRDAARGRLGIDGLFAAPSGFADRDLRVTRRSGGDDTLQRLHLTGHLLPDAISGALWLPDEGPVRVELDSRVRWLRGEVATRSKPGTVPVSRMTGALLVDHSTHRLRAEVGDRVRADLAAPARAGGRIDLTKDGKPDDERSVIRPDAVVPATQDAVPSLLLSGLEENAMKLEATLPEPGVSGRVAASFGADLPVVVRANPQVKLLQHGDREATTGLRAVSARVQGVVGAEVPATLLSLSDVSPAPGETPVTARFSKGRPNGSLRAEAQVRERRVTHPPDDRATAGVRSWLRARTAHMPARINATPAFVAAGAPAGFSFGGIALDADERWGAGVVWGEPGFAWEEHTDELGEDKGIGLITAGFDGLPAALEVWLLQHAGDLGTGRVPNDLRLPSVGPADSAWPPGGVLARLDSPARLQHVMVALPGDASRVCRTDDGDDHPVRHGNWTEAIAPFVRLEPSESGVVRAVVWSTGDAPAPVPQPPPPEPDPCEADGDGAERKSALGWDLDEKLRASFAVRLYHLNTPSGKVVPRWWAMPTSSEDWDDVDDPRCGVWWLEQEIQMKDYRGIVAFYPAEALSNPFGDWQAGPGQWWLRIRDGLDAFLGSGDAYMGNVGGGYHFLGSNGIFSTLPRIWSWTYP